LKELMPSLSAVAVLANTTNPYAEFELEHMRPAAAASRISLDIIPTTNDEQLDRALNGLRSKRPDGVVVINDQYLLSRHEKIAASMTDNKISSAYGYREFVDAGGLAYYGANYRLEFRRMADYVDKILNGTKPGDLPVQVATRFELVINLKAAKALGLAVPQTLLTSADEVIE
jgi:putative ABC transport system substrate-binding protein